MNPVIKVILVDDEIQAISNLENLLAIYPKIQILGKITQPSKAVPLIIKLDPDLVFIGIQMSEKNGFEIINELTNKGCNPAIIFVTGFNNYAIEAIRAAVFDYLVKPVNPEELKQSLERFQYKNLERKRDEEIKKLFEKTISKPKIKVSTAGGFTLLDPDEIIYIKADWNYAEIYFDNVRSELITTNLGKLEEILPKNIFFRINRSTIINTTYLKKVSRKKQIASLVKDGEGYSFKIPLLNIRKLEQFLSQ